jgi:D-serine deaminase-like pyridoxal phosphate-dependent protein
MSPDPDPVRELAARHRLARRLSAAVGALDDPATPMVVVDLDAFDANAADLVRRARGTPVRVASKSVRVPALLTRALARAGFHGLLAYALREAIWLAEQGLADDVVVAYPTVDRGALRRLARDPALRDRITLMVDDVAHLDLIDGCRGTEPVRVALDVDAGLRLGPGRPAVHVGPKRSPLHEPAGAVALARAALERGLVVDGVMTYEGQVAGVQDEVPGQRARSFAVRRLKAATLPQLAERRAAIAAALAELVDLRFWNGGGTGSVETTVADPVVTEVAAGSGLLVPALFDHYRSFRPRPAAFFGVPVVRRPGPGVATVAGGGYVASGPAGGDRLPLPWAPPGLRLTALEGAGEVQTPLTGAGADGLAIGDWVWFRHAKAGELAEHAAVVHLLAGDRIVETVPTYRGLGHAW